MTKPESWVATYTHEITASQRAIWDIMTDVSTWKIWNAGIPFKTGTWLSMILPNDELIRSKLIEVKEPLHFLDETVVNDTIVQVTHQITPLAKESCRVNFIIKVEGPQAKTLGEEVSADFPEVLAELAKYIENGASQ